MNTAMLIRFSPLLFGDLRKLFYKIKNRRKHMAFKDSIEMAKGALEGYMKRWEEGEPTDYPLELTMVTVIGTKKLVIRLEDV